jgi:hypothetical protein
VFAAYGGRVVEVETGATGVRGNVTLFRALTDASPAPYSIPLYEPTTEHERGMLAMFTKALELGRPVEVEYRESAFFGTHRVPASVGIV